MGMMLSAAARDDTPALQKCIAEGVSVDINSQLGQAPLHIACLWGNVMSLELLIQAGADVNIQNSPGMTPLHFAANGKGFIAQRLKCARALVAAGADVTIEDNDGHTPYDCVADQQGNDELKIEALRELLTPKGLMCIPFSIGLMCRPAKEKYVSPPPAAAR